MKKYISLFLALITITFVTSCSSDDDPTSRPTLTPNGSNAAKVSMTYDITKSGNLSFNASDSWEVTNTDEDMTVTPSSGKAGNGNVTVTMNTYNSTNYSIDHYFTVTSTNSLGTTEMKVTVTAAPVFEVDNTVIEADAKGDTIQILFNTDADLDDVGFGWNAYSDFEAMCPWCNDESGAKSAGIMNMSEAQHITPIEVHKCETTRATSKYKYYASFPISKNNTGSQRSGDLVLCLLNTDDTSCHSEWITVNQLPTDIKCSTDTITGNGEISMLQTHTKGNGVPLVIMGDGFLDTDVADGTYKAACERGMEAAFALYPMKSLREYFDVYQVTAISYNNVFSDQTKTAFSCVFGEGTEITGNNDKAIAYAEKAVGSKNIDNATILVVLNSTKYAGTCIIYSNDVKGDVPSGYSVAFIPLSTETDEELSFETVLNHEAIGHGLAKLGDEYSNDEEGTISESDKNTFLTEQSYGLWRNVSAYSDVTKSYWADLAADSRYSYANLGCYEGCDTYVKGLYRSTEESIMRDNTGGFTPQQRRLIYNRCMRIAMGTSWSPSLEEFASFDAPAREAANSTTRAISNSSHSMWFRPLAKPHVKHIRK